MKSNKKLITLFSILAAFTSFLQAERKYAQKHDENVIAATAEMPGNVVSSLFGGGYANRKRIDNDETKVNNPNKQSSNQPANRRQARRQRRRSSSSEE